MVFNDAVRQTGSSIKAVADAENGGKQGAGELVCDLNRKLDRLGAKGHPGEVTITWIGESMCGLIGPQSYFAMRQSEIIPQ